MDPCTLTGPTRPSIATCWDLAYHLASFTAAIHHLASNLADHPSNSNQSTAYLTCHHGFDLDQVADSDQHLDPTFAIRHSY